MDHAELPRVEWTLLEALLWIVFRDESSVQRRVRSWLGHEAWSSKQVIQAGREAAHNHVFSTICPAEQIDPDDPLLEDKVRSIAHQRAHFRHQLLTPESMLMDSLRTGVVLATGVAALGARELVNAEHWQDAQFYGSQNVVIMDADDQEQPVIIRKWLRVRFDRQSLLAAFPHELQDERLKERFQSWAACERRTIEDCVAWGKDHGVTREWIRDQRKLVPAEAKRAAGEKRG